MNIKEFAEKYRLHTRVDTDGTTIIPGLSTKRYSWHIYEYDDDVMGVMIIVPPKISVSKHWTYSSKVFRDLDMGIVQDGDMEGAATFDPRNQAQVKAVLKAARVKHKRIMSPAQREVAARGLERLKTLRRMKTSGPPEHD